MPVIIEQVTIELRESVDYIAVTSASGDSKANGSQVTDSNDTEANYLAASGVGEQRASEAAGGGKVTRVPTDSVFTVVVQPVYSRKKIKEKFNLKDFANGTLAKDGFI